jgi:hypothetical protein
MLALSNVWLRRRKNISKLGASASNVGTFLRLWYLRMLVSSAKISQNLA